MYTGVLICESLRTGIDLTDTPLTLTAIDRVDGAGVSPQPSTWRLLRFSVADDRAEALAERLGEVLDAPGWYADFRSETEVYVVYPGRVFRYLRGDQAGRAAAVEWGLARGLPPAQAEWGD